MEEFINKYVKTVYVEAKYSLISKGFPIDLDEGELEKLNYDAFKVSLKEEIENLDVKDLDLEELKQALESLEGKKESKKVKSKK